MKISMTSTEEKLSGSLSEKDFWRIEHLLFRLNDDLCVSIARSLERLENRLDNMETSLNTRLSELSERIDDVKNHTP